MLLAMEHANLGRTGLVVSRICLGTMTFGLQCDESTSSAIMDAAAEGGVNFFDTADVYPLGGGLDTVGRTEEIVGGWLKAKRSDFIVATKCVGPTGRNRWDQGMSRKHILDAIDGSLRRLGTDYVDLYQLHGYDRRTPLDEALEALDIVVRSGKARYVGVSNWLAYQVARAVGRSEAKGIVRIDSVQPRYNLLFRQIERELLPACDEEGIGVIPYNPLAGGVLTGKHDRNDAPEEGTRFTLGRAGEMYRDRYWHERQFDTVDALGAVAPQAGMSLTTMAVAWVLANPVITSAIVGASRPEQLEQSLAAAQGPLDHELKVRLDELTSEWRLGDAAR
jgi:1-deoxyxylulose-5-phosphate synthase